MESADKVKGSLWGLIWGDVVGCPVETWKENEINSVYGGYSELPTSFPVSKISSVNSRYVQRLRPLGLHSDDGQQAMGLLNVCLSNPTWSKKTWADMLVAGNKKGSWRGTGRFFNDAVRKMIARTPLEMTGSPSSGIGSAMRIAPVGALYRDDLRAMKKAVLESSLMTHGDIAAAAYSYAVAYVVFQLVNGKSSEDVKLELADAVLNVEKEMMSGYKNWKLDRKYKHVVSETIRVLFSDSIDDLEETRNLISKLAKPHLAEGFSKAHPNQGFVLTGGMHALVMGLQNVLSPQEALLSVVRMGYDTDTVAAIAGGILGARFGDSWIPKDRVLDASNVEKYAQAIVDRNGVPETSVSFLTREADWTKKENQFPNTLK